MKVGNRVRYIPSHANGDASSPDCEDGIVRTIRGEIAFVVYDNAVRGIMETLEDAERWTAAGTNMDYLIMLDAP